MPGRMESVENLSRQQYRVRGAVDGFPPFPPPLGNRYAIPTVPQPRRRRYLSYEQETQGDTSIELPRGTFLLGVDKSQQFVGKMFRPVLLCSPVCNLLGLGLGMQEPALGSLPGTDKLTPRQRDVAALVREGLYAHQIARVLGTTSASIDLEMQSIYSVLGVTDPLTVAMYAQQRKLRFRRPAPKSASAPARIA